MTGATKEPISPVYRCGVSRRAQSRSALYVTLANTTSKLRGPGRFPRATFPPSPQARTIVPAKDSQMGARTTVDPPILHTSGRWETPLLLQVL